MMVRSHDKLQSETGYIDARPHPLDRRNLLQRTAGPYIWVTLRRTHSEQKESASSPLSGRRADILYRLLRAKSCRERLHKSPSELRSWKREPDGCLLRTCRCSSLSGLLPPRAVAKVREKSFNQWTQGSIFERNNSYPSRLRRQIDRQHFQAIQVGHRL